MANCWYLVSTLFCYTLRHHGNQKFQLPWEDQLIARLDFNIDDPKARLPAARFNTSRIPSESVIIALSAIQFLFHLFIGTSHCLLVFHSKAMNLNVLLEKCLFTKLNSTCWIEYDALPKIITLLGWQVLHLQTLKFASINHSCHRHANKYWATKNPIKFSLWFLDFLQLLRCICCLLRCVYCMCLRKHSRVYWLHKYWRSFFILKNELRYDSTLVPVL